MEHTNKDGVLKVFTRKGGTALLLWLIVALVSAIVLAVGMRFAVIPWLYQIDEDFTYQADLISLDNFYDEEQEVFMGEQRTVSSFGYRFLEDTPQGALVQNFFDVRTVSGEKIIEIIREYGVNPYTHAHVPDLGDRARSGYIFAPRHLVSSEPLTYWHVNYDTSVTLQFIQEETVEGLPVYQYETSFTVDQTDDLTHLPGVPEERGVRLDVVLQLWIEPTSGWLVKYEDHAEAYYYDQNTNERLVPWNTFKNKYRHTSINEQVANAYFQKRTILALEYLVPVVFFFLIIISTGWYHRRTAVILFGGLGLLSVLIVGYLLFVAGSDQKNMITIGISRWVPDGNPVYTENINGFKEALAQAGYQEGVSVTYFDRTANSQRDQQHIIAKEFDALDVDLIYSLTTPGTAIIKEHITDIPIVFSIVTYPVEAGIVDSLQGSNNNLVGTRNWVPVEEQLNVFREIVPSVTSIGFVRREGEANSTIQLEEMRQAVAERDIEVIEIAGKNLEELTVALEQAPSVSSVFSACDTLVQSEAEEVIITFAQERDIPSFSCNATGPYKGDLVGTVADFRSIGKVAGEKAVLILEGATPASLTTDTVIRPFVIVNLQTAKRLNITVPQSVLTRAKEIIP